VIIEDLDSVNSEVIKKICLRAELGMQNYGVTMDRDDLSLLNWLQHLQEEMLDACVYIEKILMKKKEEQDAKAHQRNSSGSKEGEEVQS
jgi:hypothetical protein